MQPINFLLLLKRGGVPPYLDDFGRADGAAGNGWTNVNIASNQASIPVVAGSELFADPGCETWSSATNLTNWLEEVAGTSTVNQESTTKHGGSFSARLDVDSSNNNVKIKAQITLPTLRMLRYSFWARGGTGTPTCRPETENILGPTVTLSTTFQQFYWVLRVGGANEFTGVRRLSAASNSIYLDDHSAKELTLSSLLGYRTQVAGNAYAQANWTIQAYTQAGICHRSDNSNFVIAYYNIATGRVHLDKYVAGTPTAITSAVVAYSAGAALRLTKNGTSYSVDYNGSAAISAQTIADSAFDTATDWGLYATDASSLADNYQWIKTA